MAAREAGITMAFRYLDAEPHYRYLCIEPDRWLCSSRYVQVGPIRHV